MALWSFCDFDFPLGSVTVRTTKDLSCLPCILVFLVVMCSSLISCFISVSSSLISCSSVLTSSENCELYLGLYWHQNGKTAGYCRCITGQWTVYYKNSTYHCEVHKMCNLWEQVNFLQLMLWGMLRTYKKNWPHRSWFVFDFSKVWTMHEK